MPIPINCYTQLQSSMTVCLYLAILYIPSFLRIAILSAFAIQSLCLATYYAYLTCYAVISLLHLHSLLYVYTESMSILILLNVLCLPVSYAYLIYCAQATYSLLCLYLPYHAGILSLSMSIQSPVLMQSTYSLLCLPSLLCILSLLWLSSLLYAYLQ